MWSVKALAGVLLLLALGAGPLASQTQADMNAQVGAELEASDQRLNTAYRALRAKISEAGRGRLQAAQQSWLRFRDQECTFETAGTVGGSIHGMMVALCQKRLIDQRTADLEKLLNCQEGDLSCAGL
ncbi:lysozyme inhibitor LprI family protein [Reyranella sp.]|uniref:lysozyme inhibitor LprI family protein n=1 Tax=Reyranella sp. TaxID=1929291 RepID=UPI003BAAD620